MTSSDLDLRLMRFRSRRDEFPQALASALIEAGRPHDALEVIHLGMLDDEADVELLTLEGRAFYEQGHLREAQGSLLRAAKLNPSHKEPYRWLAQVLIERGEAQRAVQVLERALTLDPADPALRQAHARAQRLASAVRGQPLGRSGKPSSVPPARATPGATSRSALEGAGRLPASGRRGSEPPGPGSVPPGRPGLDPAVEMRGSGRERNAEARGSARERNAEARGPGRERNAEARGSAREPSVEGPGFGREQGREPRSRGASSAPPAAASTPGVSAPGALGDAGQELPANHNAPARKARGRLAEAAARAAALWPRPRPKPDAIAQDLLREAPAESPELKRALRPPRTPEPPLYSEDLEEESPTTAMEVPEEVRGWLRRDAGSVQPFFPPDREEEDSSEFEPTSIVPAARELELLNRERARRARVSTPKPRAPADARGPTREAQYDARGPTREPQYDARAQAHEPQYDPRAQAHEPHYDARSSARDSPFPFASREPQTEPLDDPTIVDDLPRLADPGQAEPPEQVLALLKAQGIYEGAQRTPAQERWARRQEVARSGTPIQRALLMGWALALLAAVGGYYGFQAWLVKRRGDASGLIERARADALDGAHASLLAAEQTLSEARALDPRSHEALEGLLFVRAARTLEEGSSDVAAVRETAARAAQVQLSSPLVAVAEAIARSPVQRKDVLDQMLARAQREAWDDPRALYLAGRLAQRAGRFDAAHPLLARATSLEPQLALAWLAQGEQARAEGQLDRAKEWLERALGPDRRALRAELWLAVLGASEAAGELVPKIEALMPRVQQGSDAEKLLGYSAQAYAQLAADDTEQARASLRKASALAVADPELLAFFSQQALRAGEPLLAYRAARAASDAAGGTERYQALVAAALLQQGQGEAALTALANVGDGHGALALARAEAALLTGARPALEAAKRELASYRASAAGKDDVESSSLLMRVDLRLGANGESLLPAARALVQRAPDSAGPHLALGEVLVAAGQGAAAVAALGPALRLAPGSADAHYLLGRAQRLAGHANDARASFERAVQIATNHLEARRALGRTLREAGEYDAALALFRELERAGAAGAGVGAAEALLGKGNVDQAASLLDALPEPIKGSPEAVLARARLLLARQKAGEAIALLEPLVAEDAETRDADALTLYGDAQYAADRVDPAAQAYDAALELDAALLEALLGRALSALRADKAASALGFLERAELALAQRARPPSFRARLLVAAARAELLGVQPAQLARAKDRLARATALSGAPAESFFWYGEALTRSNTDGAKDQYAKYLALEPNGPYAVRAKRAVGPR